MKDCRFVRKRTAYFLYRHVISCYFVNIVQPIIVEEVHVHSLKTFETRQRAKKNSGGGVRSPEVDTVSTF